MPIARNYGPPAALMGAIAFQGGLGQFNQKRDKIAFGNAMDTARLALAARDSDRQFSAAQQARNDALVARAQNMALQQQQQATAIAASQQQQANQYAQQAYLQQASQSAQQAYLDKQNKFLLERDANQLDAQKDQFRAENQAKLDFEQQRLQRTMDANWQQAQGIAAVQESQGAAASLRGIDESSLKPDGLAARNGLLADYEKIRKQRSLFPPQAYAGVVSQWLDRVNEFNSEIESHQIKTPTLNELWDQETFVHPEFGPMQRTMRSGSPKWEQVIPPGKAQDKTADDGMGSMIKDEPMSYSDWKQAAVDELMMQAQQEYKAADAKAKMAAENGGKYVPPPDPSYPSSEAINDKIDELMREKSNWTARHKGAEAAAVMEATDGAQQLPYDGSPLQPQQLPYDGSPLQAQELGFANSPDSMGLDEPFSLDGFSEDEAQAYIDAALPGQHFIVNGQVVKKGG